MYDFCQPITDVYCGQLTNESAYFLALNLEAVLLVNVHAKYAFNYQRNTHFVFPISTFLGGRSDQVTPVNLANHAYYNLAGHKAGAYKVDI